VIEARNRLKTRVFLALAVVVSVPVAPAAAQESPDARLRRIEAEVRALQRKVFPGGGGRFFEAEIVPPQGGPVGAAPLPATGPLTDLIARLDGVERALARATAQAEESANRMGKLEARIAALEGAAPPGPLSAEGPARPPMGGPFNPSVRPGGGPLPTGTAGVAGQGAAAERLAAVAAVEKPVSDDTGEDEYLYGYRLWEAKFFPEAQQQLKLAIERFPRHKRTSYSRNLLGRAYLDDGKPGTAAQVFLENYQSDKKGARAPDSLLFLAVAMTRLGETQRACVALAELADAYPAEVAGRLAGQYADARAGVTCR
jgi:TolA-binding protein